MNLHKFRGGLLAKLRAVWWRLVRRYDSELCYDCGRPYLLWWCDNNALYSRIAGYAIPDGLPFANGLCCPACFDRRAEAQGVSLEWRPVVFRSATHDATHHDAGEGE